MSAHSPCAVCGGEQTAATRCDCLQRLDAFRELMRQELVANIGKGGRTAWRRYTPEFLIAQVFDHAAKLSVALSEHVRRSAGRTRPMPWGDDVARNVREFAADTANMSFMLLDMLGMLDGDPLVSAHLVHRCSLCGFETEDAEEAQAHAREVPPRPEVVGKWVHYNGRAAEVTAVTLGSRGSQHTWLLWLAWQGPFKDSDHYHPDEQSTNYIEYDESLRIENQPDDRRYIVSEAWDHRFPTDDLRVRWVLDTRSNAVIYAEMQDGDGWRPMGDVRRADLEDSLLNANQILTSAENYGARRQASPPDWMPAEEGTATHALP